MLRHEDIWVALDRLAQDHSLTASGLAKKAGLDPTTFNRSKRKTSDGRLRWPSTESLAKVLEATGVNATEFFGRYLAPGTMTAGYRNVPLLKLADAANDGFFDGQGLPAGNGWDALPFPELGDPNAFALEVNDDRMEPVYREGDIIIVCPEARLRRGDRVIVKLRDGDLLGRIFRRRTAHRIEFQPFAPGTPEESIAADTVTWVARITWASQ